MTKNSHIPVYSGKTMMFITYYPKFTVQYIIQISVLQKNNEWVSTDETIIMNVIFNVIYNTKLSKMNNSIKINNIQ
jgi:hypothetical protein